MTIQHASFMRRRTITKAQTSNPVVLPRTPARKAPEPVVLSGRINMTRPEKKTPAPPQPAQSTTLSIKRPTETKTQHSTVPALKDQAYLLDQHNPAVRLDLIQSGIGYLKVSSKLPNSSAEIFWELDDLTQGVGTTRSPISNTRQPYLQRLSGEAGFAVNLRHVRKFRRLVIFFPLGHPFELMTTGGQRVTVADSVNIVELYIINGSVHVRRSELACQTAAEVMAAYRFRA